jgi:cellulose synthase operon protein C
MSQPCSDLIHFADGELEPERAHAFRIHLLTCESCRIGLVEALQLDVRLVELPPLPAEAPTTPEAARPGKLEQPGVDAVPAGGAPAGSADQLPGGQDPTPAARQRTRRRRKPRCAVVRGVIVGAVPAAAIATLLVVRTGPTVAPVVNIFAEVQTRPHDIRFAYADVASHRPRAEPMRGASSRSAERPTLAGLAALEQRGDMHGLAIARAWSGVNPNEIAEQLRGLSQTPAVRGDRAAIGLLTTTDDNLESVLAELEVLKASDDALVARAARWNYAVALSRLALRLGAAKAFRDIAAEREPGWSDEAAERATTEDKGGRDSWKQWENANRAGEALVKTGAPVPPEAVTMFPGSMRMYFYNAMRTAPNRERVLALAPMAEQLDSQGGEAILKGYVERVAGLDFQRRAPIAGIYARFLDGAELDAADLARLTTPVSDDVADIVMGAMVELGIVADHLDAFRTMSRRLGDPWFEIVLARAEAAAEVGRGNWIGAEGRLRDAEKRCSPAVMYPCFARALQLGKLYQDLHRVPEAIDVLYSALGASRKAGEWGEYRLLLWRLADVERFHSSTATARAYANEYLQMVEGCDQGWAYRILTGAALLDVDGRAARRYLEATLGCGEPDLTAANYLTDIGRLDPKPDDLPRLQGWLSALRASDALTPAARALADEIEGRLLIERDRTAGIALLERAIAAATKLPDNVDAHKARAGAYSVLTFDAARQRDHARVVALIAQALGVVPPDACAVGVVAEDERSVVVVRGADGKDHGTYDGARGPRAAAPVVPDALARQLAGCERVQVLAQAALQGQPRVLPANLPWSYATGAHGAGPRNRSEQGVGTTLVVANVTPPAALDLPALAPVQAPGEAIVLSGPMATPTKVLAAMSRASEIQFHTHALVNLGVSDASHLILSPDLDGNHALTAEMIRSGRLRGRPLVVLAACESAQGARYQHAPWSLPHAFLAAGARAVFAAATRIPDREAGPFFARVLNRVRAGADPAAALRDERMTELQSNPSSWAADVILFE